MTFCTRPLKYSRSHILDFDFEQWLVEYWLWCIIWRRDTPAAGNLFLSFFSVPILRCVNDERYSCVCCMSGVRICSQLFLFFFLCAYLGCADDDRYSCVRCMSDVRIQRRHIHVSKISSSLSLSLSWVPYAERYKTTSLMQTKSFFFPSQNNLAFQGLLLIYLLLATTLISKTHTKSTCRVHK